MLLYLDSRLRNLDTHKKNCGTDVGGGVTKFNGARCAIHFVIPALIENPAGPIFSRCGRTTYSVILRTASKMPRVAVVTGLIFVES